MMTVETPSETTLKICQSGDYICTPRKNSEQTGQDHRPDTPADTLDFFKTNPDLVAVGGRRAESRQDLTMWLSGNIYQDDSGAESNFHEK